MSLTEVAVEGTLRPEGTVALDERSSLPPGRVTVVLRPAAPEDWFQYMLNARKQMEDAGCHFMDNAELKARGSKCCHNPERRIHFTCGWNDGRPLARDLAALL